MSHHVHDRMVGKINITVLRAYEMPNASAFGGANNLQVSITVNRDKQRTRTIIGAGAAADFNQTLIYNVDCHPIDVVNVKVKHDSALKDPTIGCITLSVADVLKHHKKKLQFQLVDEDSFKPRGFIELIVWYDGTNHPCPPPVQVAPVPIAALPPQQPVQVSAPAPAPAPVQVPVPAPAPVVRVAPLPPTTVAPMSPPPSSPQAQQQQMQQPQVQQQALPQPVVVPLQAPPQQQQQLQVPAGLSSPPSPSAPQQSPPPPQQQQQQQQFAPQQQPQQQFAQAPPAFAPQPQQQQQQFAPPPQQQQQPQQLQQPYNSSPYNSHPMSPPHQQQPQQQPIYQQPPPQQFQQQQQQRPVMQMAPPVVFGAPIVGGGSGGYGSYGSAQSPPHAYGAPQPVFQPPIMQQQQGGFHPAPYQQQQQPQPYGSHPPPPYMQQQPQQMRPVQPFQATIGAPAPYLTSPTSMMVAASSSSVAPQVLVVPPAPISTPAVGQMQPGSRPFDDMQFLSSSRAPYARIVEVRCWATESGFVHGVQCLWVVGGALQDGPVAGSQLGLMSSHKLAPDENISGVAGRVANHGLEALALSTTRGHTYRFGASPLTHTAGREFEIPIALGHRVVGFHGSFARDLTSLGAFTTSP